MIHLNVHVFKSFSCITDSDPFLINPGSFLTRRKDFALATVNKFGASVLFCVN